MLQIKTTAVLFLPLFNLAVSAQQKKFKLGAWIDGDSDTPASFNKKLGYNVASFQAAQSIPFRLSEDKTMAFPDPDPALNWKWFSNVSNWDDKTDASVFMTVYADQILANNTQGMDLVSDEMIKHLALRLAGITRETGREVYMRWLPEMNGDWMLYGRMADQYTALWQRMGAIMRTHAPTVKIVWSPNFDLKVGDVSYWPGTKYVDVIGTSVYFKGWGENYAIAHDYASESIDTVYTEYAQKYNLPFVISEASGAWESGPGRSPVTGGHYDSVVNDVDQATFQQQFWAGIMSPDIIARFPLLEAAYIFEITKVLRPLPPVSET
ncbi:UNVERIFIED_CONTAM: hypothetical protein HDU68_005805 [Siphonaria sp. JEL0065]|nr:hypothetical protein HDU68_005805 [Siphonaria sp. JEL0065]